MLFLVPPAQVEAPPPPALHTRAYTHSLHAALPICPRPGNFFPGPIEPETNLGREAVEKEEATSLASRAAARLIS